jgi:hypothetical protein
MRCSGRVFTPVGAGSIPVGGTAEGVRKPAGSHKPGFTGSNPVSATIPVSPNLVWHVTVNHDKSGFESLHRSQDALNGVRVTFSGPGDPFRSC